MVAAVATGVGQRLDVKDLFASQTALGRVGVPDDIGGVVAFLSSEAGRWFTAQRLEASGGIFLGPASMALVETNTRDLTAAPPPTCPRGWGEAACRPTGSHSGDPPSRPRPGPRPTPLSSLLEFLLRLDADHPRWYGVVPYQ
jgi:hypothetical protein